MPHLASPPLGSSVRLLGLTGVMGAGKSTATACLARRGWAAFSADDAVRQLLSGDAQVRAALLDRHGATLFGPEGEVDRRALADRVFGSPGELRWLEELLHPRVLAAQECAASRAGPAGRLVCEVPLLFEKSLERHYDATVTVSCDPATQRARLRAKGVPEADIDRRIAQQLPNSEKVRRADFVLSNGGSTEFLERQVAWLDSRLIRPTRSPVSAA